MAGKKYNVKTKKDGRVGKGSITTYVLVFHFVHCKVELIGYGLKIHEF